MRNASNLVRSSKYLRGSHSICCCLPSMFEFSWLSDSYIKTIFFCQLANNGYTVHSKGCLRNQKKKGRNHRMNQVRLVCKCYEIQMKKIQKRKGRQEKKGNEHQAIVIPRATIWLQRSKCQQITKTTEVEGRWEVNKKHMYHTKEVIMERVHHEKACCYIFW